MLWPRVVAIGGGGFTHGTDPALDDFVLAQSPTTRPRFGFIGAASGDSAEKIARFYDRFAGAACRLSHLRSSEPLAIAKDWVEAQDIIYVGGGNTAHLLQGWRASGLAEVLCEAAKGGALLAGVSAGAVCWFDYALSDSGGAGLAPLQGLGLIAGSCCPHYSSEAPRRPAFEAQIAGGDLQDGIAIDDGVAVLLQAGRPPVAFSARDHAWSYAVRRAGDAAVSTPLVPTA